MSPAASNQAATAGPPRLRWRRPAWFKPPRLLRLTRTGRVYLIVTVGIGIGALNTGNNLLYLVLGLLLSIIVVSGVLSERVLRNVELTRLGAETAFASERFAYRWELRATRAPLFALTVREVESPLAAEAKVAYVGLGETRVVRAEAEAPQRGPLPLKAIEVTTTFPFGLFSKGVIFEAPGHLLVFPRRMPSKQTERTARPSEEGHSEGMPRPGGEGELLELVELRDGEDARRTHWLKSAALGKWVRAEREQELERAVVLRVPTTGSRNGDDALCEQAAARAGKLLRQGFAVGLEAEGLDIRAAAGAAQERRLLVALAQVGFARERA